MSNRLKLSIAVLVAVCLGALATLRLSAQDQAQQAAGSSSSGQRFFEMRTYHCAEGKLEALHTRFRNHTNRLFKKHGIELVGYWTPADDPSSKNTLVFILAYPNRQAREKSWKAFENDPDWKAAKADSERDGPLVTKVDQLFMNPTDYSPIR